MIEFITSEVVVAYTQCKRKAFFLLNGKQDGMVSEYIAILDEQTQKHKTRYIEELVSTKPDAAAYSETALANGNSILLNARLNWEELTANADLLLQKENNQNKRRRYYEPAIVVGNYSITKEQILEITFAGYILSKVQDQKIESGAIITADKKPHRVKLEAASKTIDPILKELRKWKQTPNQQPPPLILNKHCPYCPFKEECLAKAKEIDHLSLLQGISRKEIEHQNKKGIFTVTQLSYTFRVRRKPKRLAYKPDPYSHALRALTIREQKIYIVGKPELKLKGNPVYLDVEGVPDRDFYYLIGLRYQNSGSDVQTSFWANDMFEEKEILVSFLQTLKKLKNPQLVHYGNYETVFLKRMKERYAKDADSSAFLDQLIAESVNVLGIIYAQVYFPTYSNGLKDIANYLGFQWSESGASGLKALIWRLEWELSRSFELREKLIIYNSEDCAALKKLTECIYGLTITTGLPNNSQIAENKNTEIAWVQDIIPEMSRVDWGTPKFFHSDFEYINKSSYFDYQREKVFIRTSSNLKRSLVQKIKTKKSKKIKINKYVKIKSSTCPFCKSINIIRNHEKIRTKLLLDLKVTHNGVKGQIIACTSALHRCLDCERSFRPFSNTSIPQSYNKADKYSHGLKSWVIYQHVAHRTSFESLEEMIKEYFDLNIGFRDIHIFKSLMAEYYRPTYMSLIKNLVDGRLIHADETEIKLKKSKGYIWVFTSLEEVVFMYKPTREGDFLKEMLQDFNGVLVSDYYGAYDSIPCAQQKCLIHLIRDLNDDLLKNPFNDEIKMLVQDFARLLKPMIQTVDRFGLKSLFLRKHKVLVEQFYKELFKRDYHSEIAIYYKKRFEKNQDKLFTFLDYDGIPWNNNNAEHAIKQFAHYRMISDGKMTEFGLNNYLILFSIYQTCKYKGTSFLSFLLSGEHNLDKFYESRQKKRKRSSNEFKLIIPNAELDF